MNKPIIFLNGAEVDIHIPEEVGATEHHIAMNAALDRFVAEYSNTCKLLDVRKLVKTREDCTNCIRHYKRITYVHIAEEIMRLMNKQKKSSINYKLKLKSQYFAERVEFWKWKIIHKCKKILKRK